MFSPATEAAFTLHIDGTEHDFKVLAFTGTEALNQPFAFELELISERPDIDLAHSLPPVPAPQLSDLAHRTNQRLFQHIELLRGH